MTPLARNYQRACNAYVQAFCEKHNLELPQVWERWVGDEVGQIAVIGDYFVSMRTIVTDIEDDIPEHKFFEWYDWSLEDGNDLSFKAWLNPYKEDVIHEKTQKIKELTDEFNSFLDEICTCEDECPF